MQFLFLFLILISCTDTQQSTESTIEVVEKIIKPPINKEKLLFDQYFSEGQHLIKVQQVEFLSQPSGDSNIYLLNGIYWDSNKNIYFVMSFSSTNFNDPKSNVKQYPSNFQTFSSLNTNTIIINTNLTIHSLMFSRVLVDLPDNASMNRFNILYYDTLKENYIEAQVCNVFNQGYGEYTNGECFSYTNSDYLPIYPTLLYTNQYDEVFTNQTFYTNKHGEVFYHSSFDPGIGNLNIKRFKKK